MQAIQLFGSVLRLFAYFVLAQGITLFFLQILSRHPIETYTNIELLQGTPDLLQPFMISDMIGKIVGFVILPILYLFISKQPDANPFKQDPRIPFTGISVVLGVASLILMLPGITVIAEINKDIHLPQALTHIEDSIRETEALAEALTMLFVNIHTLPEILLSILALAVVPAIGEEIIFRGFFQRELIQQTKNIHLSVWIAAAVFSFIHFQFLGFFPRMLLGALLGYMYVWSGSLLVPILMHFTNNALTLILLIAYKNNVISFNPEASDQIPYILVLISFLASAAIAYNRKKTFDSYTVFR
ncbi:MAG: lysostaphin resistance A-like protein [Cytophaga sp.]|uniref:CPBP family intramembrane glutamic endopeptidase n=1 Tax=Cytophaga sp. TaxID=29535 RepID=UPI003F7FABFB